MVSGFVFVCFFNVKCWLLLSFMVIKIGFEKYKLGNGDG